MEQEASKEGVKRLLINDNGNLRMAPEDMLLSDFVIEALMAF